MKKLYIVFMALLTWVGSAFAADELTVANITSDAGSEATLVIDFNFTTDNFTGYQFDLVLPSGIVTVKDEEGVPSFELGEEVYYKSHTVSASHLSSCDRFVCLSTNSSVFKKMQGTLLSIPICVDADVNSDTYDGKLKNIQFGTKDGKTIYFEDVPFSITIGDATLVGDVNYDGLISIADVTALVNILLGNDDAEPYKYNHKAANVNGDEDINSEDVTALMGIILGE